MTLIFIKLILFSVKNNGKKVSSPIHNTSLAYAAIQIRKIDTSFAFLIFNIDFIFT